MKISRSQLISYLQTVGLPLMVAVVCFLVYFWSDDNVTITDSVWSTHVSAEIYYNHDIALDKYTAWIAGVDYYATRNHKGKLYPFFPVGGSLLTAPLVPLYRYIVPFPADAPRQLDQLLTQYSPYDPFVAKFQLFAASLLCAVSAAFLFIALKAETNTMWAGLGAAIYAFGTPIFSSASRAMWQHAPSVLFLSLLLIALTRLQNGRRWIALAGFAVAAAYTMRPTNSIAVVVVTLFMLYQHRRAALSYFIGAATVAIPFIAFNFLFYDSLLPPYFVASRLGSPLFWQALLGNLVSPGRGILLFSPFLLFALWDIPKRHSRNPVTHWLWLIMALHLVIISSFPHWWGGHSNGPRFFTDMMPFSVYLVIPTMATVRSRLVIVLFLLLSAVSVLLHTNMSVTTAGQVWNVTPLNIDLYPNRLWNWHDPQFLRRQRDYPATMDNLSIQFEYADVVGKKVERRLYVRNATNRPIFYKLTLPRGVVILAAPDANAVTNDGTVTLTRQQPLAPNTLDIISLSYQFDTYQLQPEGGTFGAIALESRLASDQSWTGLLVASVVVIGEQADSFTLPRDIVVQDPTRLFALHGGGWFERESFESYQWRWSGKNAELYVYSVKPTAVMLETSATGFYVNGEKVTTSELSFAVNGVPTASWRGEANTPFSVRLALDAGWNRVEIAHLAGAFSPQNEPRTLGFGLNGISLRQE